MMDSHASKMVKNIDFDYCDCAYLPFEDLSIRMRKIIEPMNEIPKYVSLNRWNMEPK